MVEHSSRTPQDGLHGPSKSVAIRIRIGPRSCSRGHPGATPGRFFRGLKRKRVGSRLRHSRVRISENGCILI